MLKLYYKFFSNWDNISFWIFWLILQICLRIKLFYYCFVDVFTKIKKKIFFQIKFWNGTPDLLQKLLLQGVPSSYYPIVNYEIIGLLLEVLFQLFSLFGWFQLFLSLFFNQSAFFWNLEEGGSQYTYTSWIKWDLVAWCN